MVKKLLVLIALTSVSVWGATGDISNVAVQADGWTLNADIENVGAGHTWYFNNQNNPVISNPHLIVRRVGNNNQNDTVYIDTVLRKVYPNNASDSVILSGNNITATLALSAAICQTDTIVSAYFPATIYTGSNSYNSTCTNNSTQAVPKVIGDWSHPGQSVVTGNFAVRTSFAHYSAKNGKMVRGVRYTATDEHSHSYTTLVTSPTATIETNGNAIIEYIGTINVSGFTVGDKITVNFSAKPVWGDSLYSGDGVNTWPSPLYCPQYYKYLSDVKCAVIDPAAADNTSGQVINNSTFNPASPPAAYKNMYAGLNAIRTALGSADISGSILYLRNGNHTWYGGAITAGTVANYNLEVKNFPSESPAISAMSTSALPVDSWIHAKGLNITISTGNFATAETGFWIDSCTDNRTGGYLIYSTLTNMISYLTGSTINYAQDIPYSTTNNPLALIRSNNYSVNVRVIPYMVIGNKSVGVAGPQFVTAYSGMTIPAPDNVFIGFNKITKNALIAGIFGSANCIHGAAIVQNIFEKTTTTEPCIQIAADASTSANVNNVLVWNNTIVGERWNHAYNDINQNGISPPPYRSWWSIKNNILHRESTVADVDAHGGAAAGPRNGGWSVRYGVQRSGNLYVTRVFDNEFWGPKSINPTAYTFGANKTDIQNYLKFVSDKSYVGDGTGSGDYHLQAGSPAIGNSYDWVLPYDLDGNRRKENGAIGAFGYNENATQFTLTITATNGTVTLSPSGGTYDSATEVTLTPVPSTGYVFSSWSGDLTGNQNPATVVMDGNKGVTANFKKPSSQDQQGPFKPAFLAAFRRAFR